MKILFAIFLLISFPARAAYYAQLDKGNVVLRVVVVDDEVEQGSEFKGITWCQDFFGGKVWLKTAVDGSIRKNYAGPGYVYYPNSDLFASPSPYPSWTLDLSTGQWMAPTPRPNDGTPYRWDEPTLSWVSLK